MRENRLDLSSCLGWMPLGAQFSRKLETQTPHEILFGGAQQTLAVARNTEVRVDLKVAQQVPGPELLRVDHGCWRLELRL